MVLSCNVRLLKLNESKIANSKEVAIANNFLNTLWKSSNVFLNSVPVNSSGSFHYIKSALVKYVLHELHISPNNHPKI